MLCPRLLLKHYQRNKLLHEINYTDCLKRNGFYFIVENNFFFFASLSSSHQLIVNIKLVSLHQTTSIQTSRCGDTYFSAEIFSGTGGSSGQKGRKMVAAGGFSFLLGSPLSIFQLFHQNHKLEWKIWSFHCDPGQNTNTDSRPKEWVWATDGVD